MKNKTTTGTLTFTENGGTVGAIALSGPASGQWDSTTETAMQKYQADHGWQTKLTPDSRALIKLGLGPHDAGEPAATASAATPPGASAAVTTHTPPPAALASSNSVQN